eukprot:TRINITY_DN7260_c0_g1_i2.p1 TRINITY_DN7260_c0_g1~~TRINITY_DN7260_c0_g1_i2.p1  ORF type:complete len:392 (+),score=85.56 TRINITY_DN7260_c0_g1_i2:17-1192(+)
MIDLSELKRMVYLRVNDDKLYCICKGRDDGGVMIRCSQCKDWFHSRCVKIPESIAIELSKDFKCPPCINNEPNPVTKQERESLKEKLQTVLQDSFHKDLEFHPLPSKVATYLADAPSLVTEIEQALFVYANMTPKYTETGKLLLSKMGDDSFKTPRLLLFSKILSPKDINFSILSKSELQETDYNMVQKGVIEHLQKINSSNQEKAIDHSPTTITTPPSSSSADSNLKISEQSHSSSSSSLTKIKMKFTSQLSPPNEFQSSCIYINGVNVHSCLDMSIISQFKIIKLIDRKRTLQYFEELHASSSRNRSCSYLEVLEENFEDVNQYKNNKKEYDDFYNYLKSKKSSAVIEVPKLKSCPKFSQFYKEIYIFPLGKFRIYLYIHNRHHHRHRR